MRGAASRPQRCAPFVHAERPRAPRRGRGKRATERAAPGTARRRQAARRRQKEGREGCASVRERTLRGAGRSGRGHISGLGSARLGSARLGSARLGSARLGSARLGSARLGLILAAVVIAHSVPPRTCTPRARRRHGWARSHSHRRLETRDPRPGGTVFNGRCESDHHWKRLSTCCKTSIFLSLNK